MLFDGKIDVGVSPVKAWDFLLDINELSSCLPGLESLKQIDERSFDGMVGATVGPVSGKFQFRAIIVESQPPRELIVRTEGTDSVTKSTMRADLTLTLSEVSTRCTELNYRADVRIEGRLAILGDMVLRAGASLFLDEFSKRIRRRLEEDDSGHG